MILVYEYAYKMLSANRRFMYRGGGGIGLKPRS